LTVRPRYRAASIVPVALLLAAGSAARAEEPAPAATAIAVPAPTDSLPGSSAPPGLGLSPQAPPAPPAPGGTPSFGTPTGERPSSFRIGGRFFGWQAFGAGAAPATPVNHSGTPVHAPLLSTGKIPFWGGAGATLNFQYGTPMVTAFVSYHFRLSRAEYQGYTNPQLGPSFGLAYLLVTPRPLGPLRLNFRVGGFVENYAGPGQWGWGVFGPMLALRGYGETTNGDWDLSRDVRVTFNHGVLAVPGVPQDFARGEYNSWIETGVSNYVHHAHLGLILSNQYTVKLHYASTWGTDERVAPAGCGRLEAVRCPTLLGDPPMDGRMDTYLGEARWQADPWGQLGVSGGLYNFKNAASVGDGTWWAIDWTQGAREMINKFLGPASQGNGKLAVIGAEYNFSVSRILWAPRSFNGDAPDLRIAIAGMLTRTVASDDPLFKNATGYYFGLETEYRMTSLFSLTFQAYGERRDSALDGVPAVFSVYSVNPGIAFRTDWLSTDRIQLIYGRRFYSHAADPNSARPLDRNMIALGGYITF
jgi:hypothetical protein